jgi:hypothetical protein
MPELGPYGSVRGARGNSRPYRESWISGSSGPLMTHLGRPELTHVQVHTPGLLRLPVTGAQQSARFLLPSEVVSLAGRAL